MFASVYLRLSPNTADWSGSTREPSDLPQDLHDGDGGALAEDEGSAEQRDGPPQREDHSGRNSSRR